MKLRLIIAALALLLFVSLNGALLRAGALMARATWEWVARAMGTDKLMTEVDESARAAYEQRVEKSSGDRAVN